MFVLFFFTHRPIAFCNCMTMLLAYSPIYVFQFVFQLLHMWECEFDNIFFFTFSLSACIYVL